jgi:hypothetical protein
MADSNGRAKRDAPRFEFALIGDLPYDLEQEQRFNRRQSSHWAISL